jgi:light-regulated signal transduction histidine kinase (bacteriophytochrome)
LQEPLRKVQGFGDRLKVKYGPLLGDEGREWIGRMQNAAGRMQVMLNDLLEYSRVTTKAEPFSSVDLNEVLAGVILDLEVRIEETQGQVEVGDLPTIQADPQQMRRLLQNLVSNSLKFHQPGTAPIVKVTAETPNPEKRNGGEWIQIAVEDNGIGFEEKYLDQVFLPFQRLHGRSEYEGNGIGLAICRKIVERHRGSLTARSAPGQGAKFIITLPVRQPQ